MGQKVRILQTKAKCAFLERNLLVWLDDFCHNNESSLCAVLNIKMHIYKGQIVLGEEKNNFIPINLCSWNNGYLEPLYSVGYMPRSPGTLPRKNTCLKPQKHTLSLSVPSLDEECSQSTKNYGTDSPVWTVHVLLSVHVHCSNHKENQAGQSFPHGWGLQLCSPFHICCWSSLQSSPPPPRVTKGGTPYTLLKGTWPSPLILTA